MRYILFLHTITFLLLTSFHLNAQITYVGGVKTSNGNPDDMILSPDNNYAYCIIGTKEIHSYSKNIATGHLSFLSSITKMKDGEALYNVTSITISPDGRFIYCNGGFKIFIFSRDLSTGLLTPFQHIPNVYSSSILPVTTCNILVSKNNKHVYISGRENLAIYSRDSVSGSLSLTDTIQNINYTAGGGYNISITLNNSENLAFITGMHSISVYSRDSTSGLLTFKNRITATTSFENESLAYAQHQCLFKRLNIRLTYF